VAVFCYPCTHALTISFFGEVGNVGTASRATISWKYDIHLQKQPNSNQSHLPIKHTMSIDKISRTYNGQVHTQYLLRTSKREGQKMIKTTILDLTSFGKEACEAMVDALKNKNSLARFD
jgi:hypothetical protein